MKVWHHLDKDANPRFCSQCKNGGKHTYKPFDHAYEVFDPEGRVVYFVVGCQVNHGGKDRFQVR